MSRAPAAVSRIQMVVAILWPSFLTSGLATIFFFTLFDPVLLANLAGLPPISLLGGYSLGFFTFWLLTALTSALTCYFQQPCHTAGLAEADSRERRR